MDASENLAAIMQRRALGWTQQEIANDLSVSESSVSYHLRRLKAKSQAEGIGIFWEIMASSAVRYMNQKMKALQGLGL